MKRLDTLSMDSFWNVKKNLKNVLCHVVNITLWAVGWKSSIPLRRIIIKKSWENIKILLYIIKKSLKKFCANKNIYFVAFGISCTSPHVVYWVLLSIESCCACLSTASLQSPQSSTSYTASCDSSCCTLHHCKLVDTSTLYTSTLYTSTLYTSTVYWCTLYTSTLYTSTLYTSTLYTSTLYTSTLYTSTLYVIHYTLLTAAHPCTAHTCHLLSCTVHCRAAL